MGLDTDRVDGNTAGLHAPEQTEDRGTFYGVAGRSALDAVIVVAKQGMRIDTPRGSEGEVNVLGAE